MLNLRIVFAICLLSISVNANSVNLGTFNGTVFGSVHLPRNYSDSQVDVNWNIVVPSGLNVYLQVVFADMSYEDSLSIYDGSEIEYETVLKTSNGLHGRPFSVISSGEVATLRFVGIPSKSQFYATYSVPVTSSTMLKCTTSWQTLTSPGFPDNYESNLDIIWTLYAPIYYNIEVRWQNFSTVENQDILTIYNGENTFIPPYTQYSGYMVNDSVTWIFPSTANYLTLRFTTSDSDSASGFSINYISYPSGSGPTTSPPPVTYSSQTTTVATGNVCSGHGNFTCDCFYGYSGQNCQNEIDFCQQPINDYAGNPVAAGQFCLHGTCVSSVAGATCICDRGFAGQFCQDEVANETAITTRCALYATNSTQQLDVPIGCPSQQICIPENLNCAVYEACQKPFGWCIPSSTSSSDFLKQIKIFMQTEEKYGASKQI